MNKQSTFTLRNLWKQDHRALRQKRRGYGRYDPKKKASGKAW